jgi:acetylornithine deacetylase/succinyl-diaminopimelate desuccinylase-like protein
VSHGPDEQVAVDALARCAAVYALAALGVIGAT